MPPVAPAPPVAEEQLIGDVPAAGEPIMLDQPIDVPVAETPAEP